MTACGPFDLEPRDTDRGAEDSFSAVAGAKYEFSPGGIARICADDVDEAAEQIRDWRVELTQLERGPAHVRGILVPLGNTLVGRGQCTRAMCERGAAPAESISFLFNASDVPGRAGSLALDSSTCVVYGPGAELNTTAQAACSPLRSRFRSRSGSSSNRRFASIWPVTKAAHGFSRSRRSALLHHCARRRAVQDRRRAPGPGNRPEAHHGLR